MASGIGDCSGDSPERMDGLATLTEEELNENDVPWMTFLPQQHHARQAGRSLLLRTQLSLATYEMFTSPSPLHKSTEQEWCLAEQTFWIPRLYTWSKWQESDVEGTEQYHRAVVEGEL